MKRIISIITIIIYISISQQGFSQEWKHLNQYKNRTGNNSIQNGSWLKKDRKRNTETWKNANQYNLSIPNGNLKYKTISQIRDFYLWCDNELKLKGHEINSIGIASLVAGQLSNIDKHFIRIFIIRNKEIVWFANEGSAKVLEFAFPFCAKFYFSDKVLKGDKAIKFDIATGKKEQCEVLNDIYAQLSIKSIKKLEYMAKGKGIYKLGVNKELRFEGNIANCESRYQHAFTKLYIYYTNKNI